MVKYLLNKKYKVKEMFKPIIKIFLFEKNSIMFQRKLILVFLPYMMLYVTTGNVYERNCSLMVNGNIC